MSPNSIGLTWSDEPRRGCSDRCACVFRLLGTGMMQLVHGIENHDRRGVTMSWAVSDLSIGANRKRCARIRSTSSVVACGALGYRGRADEVQVTPDTYFGNSMPATRHLTQGVMTFKSRGNGKPWENASLQCQLFAIPAGQLAAVSQCLTNAVCRV